MAWIGLYVLFCEFANVADFAVDFYWYLRYDSHFYVGDVETEKNVGAYCNTPLQVKN